MLDVSVTITPLPNMLVFITIFQIGAIILVTLVTDHCSCNQDESPV